MELKIYTLQNNKKIKFSNSIISIQSDNDVLLNNIIKDYSPIVIENNNLFFLGDTVLDEISLFAKYPELNLVYDVIKLLDLKESFLDKKIEELTTTEKVYLNLLRNIAKINDIVVFKNIFLGLDLNNQKKYIKVINYLKNDYVVFVTNEDVNALYSIADYSIISAKKTIKYDTTDNIYTDVAELQKLKLDIPTLPYITYKAKEEKNVKLFYSKDVRDIIKDIYKHV